ncbi:MAG: hypothetical protein D6795_00690 [Deltaproteobacteria bacterium]|nr:MAG: hypothetical protein D6795_00690 [Deltaproteobacteria bacterium]
MRHLLTALAILPFLMAAPLHASVPPEQKQNAKKLADDLKAIQAKSEVTDEMKKDLYNDLMAVYGTAHKPSPSTVKQLAFDLAEALDDGTLSPQEINQLVEDLILVMTSAGITEEQAKKLLSDIQKILRASNITQEDVKKIANDLKAIQKAMKKGK